MIIQFHSCDIGFGIFLCFSRTITFQMFHTSTKSASSTFRKKGNGILQARKEPLRVFMIEWEHYTTMAENFSVLTSPLCLDELSAAKRVWDTVGKSTQRSSKSLLWNVRIRSWKLETDFSWLRIWLSLVWIKFYCKGGHFKILKFILTMKTNLTRPCKLVFGSGWI